MIKKLFLLACLLPWIPCHSQTISRAAAGQDLELLIEGIKKYNPALYIYNPDYDKESEEVLAPYSPSGSDNNDKSISIFEHFRNISRLCALSNEGHFKMGDWSDQVHQGIPGNTFAYLPVSIKIINGSMHIWEDYSDEQQFSRGDEIVAINGMPVRELLVVFHQIYPSDGRITTFVDRTFEFGFPWLYYCYIGQPEMHTFRINKDGDLRDARLKALTRDAQVENYRKYVTAPEDQPESVDDVYTLEQRENYALLTLKTFDRGSVEKYKLNSGKLYKSIFEEIGDQQVLVVDLRDNMGGLNEYADDIIPYILRDNQDNQFLKKTVSWEGKERVYDLPKPDKNVFAGKIFVLVNGRTYSAGSELARYLKEYAGAVIIGEETGTRYEGFAAGSEQYVELPNLGMRIGIPRYHIYFPESKLQNTKNRGVLPDHKIEYTFNDLVEERDLHVEKAEELIVGD